jgi:hypothetical protein
MQDACGNTITPVAGLAPSPLTCEGDMVYTFTYSDCAGNSHVWTYTYTIDIPDFTLPAMDPHGQLCGGCNTSNTTSDAGCVWQYHYPVPGAAPHRSLAKATWSIPYVYRLCGQHPCMDLYLYDRYSRLHAACRWGVYRQLCCRCSPPTPPVMQDACGIPLHQWLVWHHLH